MISGKPQLWERPGYLTNSQLTQTTQRLSQNTLFSPGNLREKSSPSKKPPAVSSDSEKPSQQLQFDLQKPEKSVDEWFVRPYHVLNESLISSSALSVHNTSSQAPLPAHSMAKVCDFDELAREYFPVTLSSTWETRRIDDGITEKYQMTQDLPARGLPPADPTPWITSNPKSPRNKGRNNNSPKTKVDHMHLMRADAPTTAAACVLSTSPYQLDLARLRLERLHLEEEFLMKVKRQEELERIRGPSPKWYELKTSKFHYEYQKNDNLLKSKEKWQELLDYRKQLESVNKTSDHQLTNKSLIL